MKPVEAQGSGAGRIPNPEPLEAMAVAELSHGAIGGLARRGPLRQSKRREAEVAAKREAVEHVWRFTVLAGGGKEELQRSLGASPRAMRRWAQLERQQQLVARLRGRPPRRASEVEREAVWTTLQLQGPMLGVEALRVVHGSLPREEIRAIIGEYREKYAREHTLLLSTLEWLQPGEVWAMDHTAPPSAVGGNERAILSVRDLASGCQLLWESELGPRAEEVMEDLERLFREHGAPLVLKCDNGSAFIAVGVGELCARWGVSLLWSPPRRPSYNGAIESSIRWLKERTEHQAVRAGRPGEWTREDLRVARERTNELRKDPRAGTRPRGEVFRQRREVTPEARRALEARLSEERGRERSARGLAPEARLTRRERTSIDRQAMRRALVALGILTITTRRIPLRLNLLPAARIS